LADQELLGRTAIITGASRGIGAAIARAFASAGANLILTGRSSDAGKDVVAAIADDGGKAEFVAADQGADADWTQVVARAEARFGGLDILILNAGVTGLVRTVDMTLEQFREVNRVNLKGAFLGLKHGAAAMRRHKRGGSVAIVSSIVGKVGVQNHLHYTASKAGVRLMAKAAALELGPEKIRVNTIHPGMTKTDMIAAFPPELAAMIPLGRYGEPEEVAKAALFLASDRSVFMTGAEIVVDGGWIAQ
jgi:NAD(P)-dependent dehydrogenase (short-subunit alcohol dehydrogenase family)